MCAEYATLATALWRPHSGDRTLATALWRPHSGDRGLHHVPCPFDATAATSSELGHLSFKSGKFFQNSPHATGLRYRGEDFHSPLALRAVQNVHQAPPREQRSPW